MELAELKRRAAIADAQPLPPAAGTHWAAASPQAEPTDARPASGKRRKKGKTNRYGAPRVLPPVHTAVGLHNNADAKFARAKYDSKEEDVVVLKKMAANERALDQAEQDKAWEKRLAVWGQEQEARERLMAQVLHERKVQVDQKVIAAEIEKEKAAEARYKLEAELGRVNAMEANKTEAGRQVRMEHRALLENQIKDKAFQRAAAEYNKMQERMASERAEAQYQAMLREQLDKTAANKREARFSLTGRDPRGTLHGSDGGGPELVTLLSTGLSSLR